MACDHSLFIPSKRPAGPDPSGALFCLDYPKSASLARLRVTGSATRCDVTAVTECAGRLPEIPFSTSLCEDMAATANMHRCSEELSYLDTHGFLWPNALAEHEC